MSSERGEERNKEKGRNIDVQEEHPLVAPGTPRTGSALTWSQSGTFRFAGRLPAHWAPLSGLSADFFLLASISDSAIIYILYFFKTSCGHLSIIAGVEESPGNFGKMTGSPGLTPDLQIWISWWRPLEARFGPKPPLRISGGPVSISAVMGVWELELNGSHPGPTVLESLREMRRCGPETCFHVGDAPLWLRVSFPASPMGLSLLWGLSCDCSLLHPCPPLLLDTWGHFSWIC